MPNKSNKSQRAGRRARRVANDELVPLTNDEAKYEEALYLHGFVDPHFSSRGPGSGSNPTAVIPFHMSTIVNIEVPTTGTTAWTTTAGGLAKSTAPMNDSGETMIVVTPYWIRGQTASPAQSCSDYAGFICDPELTFQQDVQGSADPRPIGQGGYTVLDRWDLLYPGENYMVSATNNLHASHEVPYRVVGLKAEIESTTAVLDNQGFIYGGDFESFIHDYQERMYFASGTGTFDDSAGTLSDASVTRGGVSENNRLCACGPIMAGRTYEATYLPMGDHVLDYSNKSCVTELGEPTSSFAMFVANTPAICFVISGLDTTKAYSFRLGCVMSLEVPVHKRSAVGILFGEAHLARRYMPDWSILATLDPAGHLGRAHAGWINQEPAALSHLMHMGATHFPTYAKPHQVGVSTTSTTAQATGGDSLFDKAAKTVGTGVIAQQLGKAAIKAAPQSLKRTVARSVIGRAASWLGRTAEGWAARAATALPGLASRALTALL